MESMPLSPTFQSMIGRMAAEDPAAVVLGWWRRVEMVLAYYTVSYHGARMSIAARAERQIMVDGRVSANCSERVQSLRRIRNKVAHQSECVSSMDAISFASGALDVIWEIGGSVPDELAMSSGAARLV